MGSMETEIKKELPDTKKTYFASATFVSVFIIYYMIMSFLSPARKISDINNEYGMKQTENKIADEKIFSDSTYLKLFKEKAFLQSRILMAETDSIYLTLNLSDSTANLEISGVVVHKAKMSMERISKIFTRGDEYVISSMLSSPFKLAKDYATIKKEPVMIKIAPKDTSEYKPDIIPDTSDYEPVNYMLEMENGVRIYFYQDERKRFNEKMNFFMFDLSDRFRNLWSSLKSVIVFKAPEYHPFIKIRLPKTDSKIIYRAIPRYGQLAVYR
jgi:hypothetical protein